MNFRKITSVIHQNKAELIVNPAAVSDFKKALQRKQTLRLSEDSAPHTNMKNIFQPGRCDTKFRNRDIKNALPLMIFFCWHSKGPSYITNGAFVVLYPEKLSLAGALQSIIHPVSLHQNAYKMNPKRY